MPEGWGEGGGKSSRKNLWCLTEGIFLLWGRVTGQKFWPSSCNWIHQAWPLCYCSACWSQQNYVLSAGLCPCGTNWGFGTIQFPAVEGGWVHLCANSRKGARHFHKRNCYLFLDPLFSHSIPQRSCWTQPPRLQLPANTRPSLLKNSVSHICLMRKTSHKVCSSLFSICCCSYPSSFEPV